MIVYKLESNHICGGFSCCGIINSKEKDLIKYNDSLYEIIYSESISKILRNNGINNNIYVIEDTLIRNHINFGLKLKIIILILFQNYTQWDCYSRYNTKFNL